MQHVRGFTLIEFLIYIGIVGVVLLAGGAVGMNILFGKAKLGAIDEVGQNASMVMERIEQSVRNAKQVISPAPGVSSATLSLEVDDAAKSPTVFDILDGTVRITEGGNPAVSLTSKSVTVQSLMFTNVSYSGAPDTVRVFFSASTTNPSARPEYNFSGTYYGTTNVRQ